MESIWFSSRHEHRIGIHCQDWRCLFVWVKLHIQETHKYRDHTDRIFTLLKISSGCKITFSEEPSDLFFRRTHLATNINC